jgi:acyl-CoA thioesterase
MLKPKEIVDKMINNDAFSKWLGIEILELKKGYCKIQMKVLKNMTNGFNIAHGGISYSLADSALAFASNSHGKMALSIETSISHTQKVNLNDVLTAETEELNLNSKTGLYNIKILNQKLEEIAFFKGTVYFSDKIWK